VSLPANETRFFGGADELAAAIPDGAFVAMPPDYSLVAMEAVRALVRRVESRGYATVGRIAEIERVA